MRVLLDTCVWAGAQPALEEAGFDVRWVGELPEDPGDAAILALADREGRVLVTLDKDFGELAIIGREPHKGIVRLVDVPAASQGAVSVTTLQRYGDTLQTGAIVTVEPGRTRIRPPDAS